MAHDGHARAHQHGTTNARMDSWAWKKRVRRERRRLEKNPTEAVCWLCGEPIDMNLPPLHAQAFTLDHLTPISRGGDIDGPTEPAHRSCNAARGDGRRTRRGPTPTTAIEW